MANQEIRKAMFDKGMPQWKLAKLLGVSEMTIWRMLRDELPKAEQDRIIAVINRDGETK